MHLSDMSHSDCWVNYHLASKSGCHGVNSPPPTAKRESAVNTIACGSSYLACLVCWQSMSQACCCVIMQTKAERRRGRSRRAAMRIDKRMRRFERTLFPAKLPHLLLPKRLVSRSRRPHGLLHNSRLPLWFFTSIMPP
jgi:hypothetical protein